MRLARVGIENVHAYLEDGITGWIAGGYELDYIPQVSVQEFSELLLKEKDHIQVLDVREAGEIEAGAFFHEDRHGDLLRPPDQMPGFGIKVVHRHPIQLSEGL